MSSFHSIQKKVLNASIAWWESHRPRDFTVNQHAANPTINVQSKAEHQLARATAQLVQLGWKSDESYALVNDLLELARALEKGSGLSLDMFQKKHEVYRKAEAFLGKREVNEDTTPQERPRRLVRMQRDGTG